jgi:hypothetical protein
MIKGSVIERIPPFSVVKKPVKIDEFIKISLELFDLIKQPLFSQFTKSDFISFNSIISISVSIRLESKSVILLKYASLIFNVVCYLNSKSFF